MCKDCRQGRAFCSLQGCCPKAGPHLLKSGTLGLRDPVAVHRRWGFTDLVLPCLIFEDEHLLVVNKPAGLNTHAPSQYAAEGLYDWLRERESRWATLAIIHRLDKETSGIIVFSKTALGNRSLTEQFATRRVSKKYILLTDRAVPEGESVVRSSLVRAGERYVSRPLHAGAEPAETRFKVSRHPGVSSFYTVIEAQPVTGRTHQIRVHAADKGFPILGDTLYGGNAAPRVYLHATEIAFEHPATGKLIRLQAPPDFQSDPRLAYRAALLDAKLNTAHRVINGASDGWPGWYVERFGDFLLSESCAPLTPQQGKELSRFTQHFSARGAYHKVSFRRRKTRSVAEASPKLVIGNPAPERFTAMENGLEFELSFSEGGSAGLFLDQRDNRRRLLTGHIATGFELPQLAQENLAGQRASKVVSPGMEVLNAFAYTCGYSVCAAKAGAQATSLDLSKKYLEWGRHNFLLNQLEPSQHEFIYGDVFDWLRRFAKKGRRFDVVLLDPPTFSKSKQSGVFQAERDFGKLVAGALALLKSNGVLFASSNARTWLPEAFLATVQRPIQAAGLLLSQKHFFPQPPDFPISRTEPAYLKTVWLRIKKGHH